MHHTCQIATRKHIVSLFAALFAFVAILSMAGPVVASDPPLAAHRAVYEMSLESAESRSGFHAAKGRLVFEMTTADCRGWAVNIRFVNRFTLRRGGSLLLDIQNSSFESADGKTLRFATSEYTNNKLQVRAKGQARGGAEAGEVSMLLPKKEKFSLPANTTFPLAHTLRLLRFARRGETFDEVNFYEGSSEQKAFLVSSVIGRKKPAGTGKFQSESMHDAPLNALSSWPVSISYYDPSNKDEGEELPIHQISFALYDNGVAGDMIIDYGDFKLNAVLTGLEMLEETNCNQ